MSQDTDRIRMLNDQIRKDLPLGTAVMTPGIAELGPEAVSRLIRTIAVFDDFSRENDPHEEHDFGVFDFDGQKVAFKIDYYDKALTYGSPDPTDPLITERIITLMLLEEY